MRRVFLLVVLVVSAAAGAWYFARPAASPVPLAGEGEADAGTLGTTEPEKAGAPSLAAAVPGRSRPREAHKGGAAIVGTVRRHGSVAAAKVDVIFTMSVTGGGARGLRTYFERMLVPPPALATPTASVKAGEDGRFEVAGLSPGIYDVTATAADGARGTVVASVPVDGARVEADVNLVLGQETLKGRVVHADGRPWKGLVVVDVSNAPNDPFSFLLRGAPMTADADGRFEATGLDKGQATVSAVEPEAFRATSKPVKIPHEGEFVLTVDAGLTPVAGRVVADPDGGPVAGASVMGGGQGTDLAFAVTKTLTDADGKFTMFAAPAGRNNGLMVKAAGYAPVWRQEIDPKKPLEIRLSRGARLSGRVTSDGDGRPVGGLDVSVTAVGSRNARGFPFGGGEPATTDADGRYAAEDLPAGEAMAVASGEGWVTKGWKDVRDNGYNPLAVTLRTGETTTSDLVVLRGAKASGVVLDAAGAPVSGAVVRGELASQGRRYYGGPFPDSGPATSSAADGTFALDGLASGSSYALTAGAPGRATARSAPFVADDTQPARVEVRFPVDRFVALTVLDDAAGTPLEGARVQAMVEVEKNNWRGEPLSIVSGSDGTAQVGPLSPGAVQVSVSLDEYVAANNQPVPEGESSLTIRLRRGLAVAGRVVNADKSPVAGANVGAEAGEGRTRAWAGGEVTGTDGSFRLKGLPSGTVTVQVNWNSGDGVWMQGSARAVAGAEDVVVTLAPAGGTPGGKTLVARVVDADGRPVAFAQVQFSQGNGSSGQSVRDGRAAYRAQDGSDVTVDVWGAQGADGAPLPLGPARAGPFRADAGEVEVRLPPELVITGLVKAPDGRGVRGVLVTASATSSAGDRRSYGGASLSARTDEAGAFRLGGLGPDEVRLRAQAPPEFAPAEPVTSRGGATGVEIVLKAGFSALVSVLDWQDKPVAGATVQVQPKGPDRRGGEFDPTMHGGTTTDAKGVVRLGALDPAGTYVLSVTAPEAREDLLPARTDPWTPRDETVKLGRGYVVRGQVRDLQGKPVSGAQLFRKIGEGGWSGNGVAEDGTFVIRALPPGDVTLRATMEGHGTGGADASSDPQVAEVTVRAGAENVVLSLDPGVELLVRVENWPLERRWGQASLLSDDGRGGSSTRGGQVSQDGTARWRGLRADLSYTLWIAPQEGDSLSLYQRDVRAGRGEVKVRLVAGRSITGRVLLPAGTDRPQVSANSKGIYAQGRVEPDGRYEIAGLPDGTQWKVQANARKGDQWLSGTSAAEVPAGGSADVEVKGR